MQRKPGYPVANCNIKMPDSVPQAEAVPCDEDGEQHHRRQQLINFGHAQWGFNNWSWSVNKQDLDFVDFANGKYCAGVVAFVSITVKTIDIHRENIGYATCVASMKGSAIYQARKCAVTNALRETLLSFGGSVATELLEAVEAHKHETHAAPAAPPLPPEQLPENNQNLANRPPLPMEPKNSPLNKNMRKDDPSTAPANARPHPFVPAIKNAMPNPPPPPVAKAHPMPANPPPPPAVRAPPAPAPAPRPPAPRPNSNVSFVLQPVMGGVVPPLYGAVSPPRLPPAPVPAPHPHLYPNYYEYAGPWHFTYESYDRHHGNVNLNFNIPPKNLVVNSRSGSVECKSACARGAGPGAEPEPGQFAAQGCWIKPTIFYDGFWTEQKVKKWVAEQVEKQFPEDPHKSPSPGGPPDSAPKS